MAFLVEVFDDMSYLLWLIETKNKTLKHIADLHVRGAEDWAAELHREIARNAIIKSEGYNETDVR
ncbi:hypothetical protein D3C72_2000730 [compost metagenome]